MKSILIEKPNQLAIVEREIPTPSAGEVRVKVKLAGICGSDSHIYRGHNPFAKYPRVIGHEFFGVIDAVGEGVESARVGERVAVDPVVSCGHCYPCSIGKPNVCTTLAVLGVHADGGFSEYAVVPAKNAWKIPEAVADQYAVMIEPFTIAANVTGHGQPTENDTVLVYGAGPIGLTIVQVLKGVYNVKNVIVADRIDERLEKAKERSLYIDLCNCLILICSIQHQMKVNLWTKNSYRLWLTNWPKTSKPLKTSVSLIGC